MKLLGGAPGKSKALMSGKGINAPVPTPVAPTKLFYVFGSVRAQLLGSNGICYETFFTPADVIRDDGTMFKAKY